MSAAAKLFPHVNLSDVQRSEGPVDLLVGLNYAHLHPRIQPGVQGELHLLNSEFGSGLLLDEVHPYVISVWVAISHLAHKYGQAELRSTSYSTVRQVNLVMTKKPVLSFPELEELGTVVPITVKIMSTARSALRARDMSHKEQIELKMIEENMTLDTESKVIRVHYFTVKDLSVL